MNVSHIRNMNTSLSSETILYRFEPYERIVKYIQSNKLRLTNYRKFDDPWEGFVFNCYFQLSETDSQSFLGGNRIFMMCFTDECAKESDALWRIYSDKNGVRFKTTVEKLKSILKGRSEDYYLEKMNYDNSVTDSKFFKNKGIIVSNSWDKNIIKSLFYKRTYFSHEHEIRLIAWSNERDINTEMIELDIDPNDLFEEVVFDPRIDDDELKKRSEELRGLGLNKTYKSPLYKYNSVFYKCY